ncbi:MAG: hypothetical protein R3F62_22095 [Planctomycetota bacterium]
MGSTIYQRGEAAGQRKTLARQLTKRVGDAAVALVARLQVANEAALDVVADLLAEKLTDQELVTRLDEALPRAAPKGEAATE